MKKIATISVLAVFFLAAVVFAQGLGGRTLGLKPEITKLGILGKGIAVSQNDPSVFKIIKVGLAKVKVTINNESAEITTGVLNLDNDLYKIKNIVIANDSASGDVYKNDTKIGAFSVISVLKNGETVWYGTLTIDSTTYNVYVMSVPRPIKPTELKDKVSDYCKEHPKTTECLGVAKIGDFCQNNPDDRRCQAVFRNYCERNMDDERCRNALREFCKENQNNLGCQKFEYRSMKKFCEQNPSYPKCVKISENIRVRPNITQEPEENETEENETEVD